MYYCFKVNLQLYDLPGYAFPKNVQIVFQCIFFLSVHTTYETFVIPNKTSVHSIYALGMLIFFRKYTFTGVISSFQANLYSIVLSFSFPCCSKEIFQLCISKNILQWIWITQPSYACWKELKLRTTLWKISFYFTELSLSRWLRLLHQYKMSLFFIQQLHLQNFKFPYSDTCLKKACYASYFT